MKNIYLDRFGAIVRYHRIAGSGTPLVFLAGLNFSSTANFLETATHPLLRKHGALLIDYLGTGHSETPPDARMSLEDHAETIAAVLDHEGLRACVIVGYSMGGTVGIILARARPDLVSHLIVYEANVAPGGGDGTKFIASFDEETFAASGFKEMLADLRRQALDGDAEAAALAGGWANSDAREIHASSVALVELDQDFATAFYSMSVRRTFVIGELSLPKEGAAAKPDAPSPEALRLNGIEVVVIPDAGHLIVLVKPDVFSKALASCL